MANTILIWDNNKRFVEELSIELGISFPNDAISSLEELKKKK